MQAVEHIRLPDAVTVRFGPIQLLSRFFLQADQYVRDRGIRLTIRHDMDELLRVNRAETEKGNWYPLAGAYDPRVNDLTPRNAYWISGVNEAGETVIAQAARLYFWPDSTLADHASAVLYGDRGDATPCTVECAAAHEIRGSVYFGGATWIRPDYRRFGLGGLMPQISRSYAVATWGCDWLIAFIKRELVEVGMHKAYGYSDASYSLKFPGSPWGDLDFAVARQHALELLAKIEGFVPKRSEARAA